MLTRILTGRRCTFAIGRNGFAARGADEAATLRPPSTRNVAHGVGARRARQLASSGAAVHGCRGCPRRGTVGHRPLDKLVTEGEERSSLVDVPPDQQVVVEALGGAAREAVGAPVHPRRQRGAPTLHMRRCASGATAAQAAAAPFALLATANMKPSGLSLMPLCSRYAPVALPAGVPWRMKRGQPRARAPYLSRSVSTIWPSARRKSHVPVLPKGWSSPPRCRISPCSAVISARERGRRGAASGSYARNPALLGVVARTSPWRTSRRLPAPCRGGSGTRRGEPPVLRSPGRRRVPTAHARGPSAATTPRSRSSSLRQRCAQPRTSAASSSTGEAELVLASQRELEDAWAGQPRRHRRPPLRTDDGALRPTSSRRAVGESKRVGRLAAAAASPRIATSRRRLLSTRSAQREAIVAQPRARALHSSSSRGGARALLDVQQQGDA